MSTITNGEFIMERSQRQLRFKRELIDLLRTDEEVRQVVREVLSSENPQTEDVHSDLPNITDDEAQVLHYTLDNEYVDEVEANHPTWLWVVSDYTFQGKKFSGIVSSLVKKGLVGTHVGGEYSGDDPTIWVTELGYAVWVNRGKTCGVRGEDEDR